MITIGMIAAILTTAAFVPQAIKTIRSQHAEDLSLVTFLMIFIGTLCWLVHGLHLGDAPIIYANAITAFLSGVIVIIKLKSMFVSKKA